MHNTYNKETCLKIMDEYRNGYTITSVCKRHDTAYSSFYCWVVTENRDDLKQKWEAAKQDHHQFMLDQMVSIADPKSDKILYDEKGRSDTSLLRIALDGFEKYLNFSNTALTKHTALRKLGIDLTNCKDPQAILNIICSKSSECSQGQIETLLKIYEAMNKGKEQQEIKQVLELALEKIAKLENRNLNQSNEVK